ncbi:MAG: 16S rRNA (guanine(527)-N(7))-methyltransferase RsmG [Erysipelotrichaceae bacterium]
MKLLELKQICEDKGYTLSDEQLKQLDTYAHFLKEYNQKINLTAIDDYEEVMEKHFYDSILPLFHCKIEGSIADIGAGAGFPSIPMKIVHPEIEVTIIEPLHKRCVFLTQLIEKLGLTKVAIANARAEDYIKEHRESFDYVTARAVANLNVLAELCIPFVKLKGTFIVMKGQQGEQEYQDAKRAISLLGCEKEEVYFDELTDGSKRVIFLMKKNRKTPNQYPRVYGQIKKKPLL